MTSETTQQTTTMTAQWWTHEDSLWGGETFQSPVEHSNLGIGKEDLFRIEKKADGAVHLIPFPNNQGDWKENHDRDNPIELHAVSTQFHKRAFEMYVTRDAGQPPKKYHLVERHNSTVFFTPMDPDDPNANGSTASIRR